MKTLSFPVAAAGIFAVTLMGNYPMLAATQSSPAAPGGLLADSGYYSGYGRMEFRDSREAEMLRRAYQILATGNHDYEGHRVKAMQAVADAGRLLGMNLGGDLQDRTPQEFSDDKLREARELIRHVQGAAEVRDQRHVFHRLDEAVEEIDRALRHD